VTASRLAFPADHACNNCILRKLTQVIAAEGPRPLDVTPQRHCDHLHVLSLATRHGGGSPQARLERSHTVAVVSAERSRAPCQCCERHTEHRVLRHGGFERLDRVGRRTDKTLDALVVVGCRSGGLG
jgi:hypothetical protein